MISHKHKCIFVHIPKVAGQSIELFFLKLHGLNWKTRAPLLLRYNPTPEIGPPRLAHLKLPDYVNFQYISEDLFNDYYKFAFVRNPWSRTVSFYKYGGFNQIMSFKAFVTKELPKLMVELEYFYGLQYDYIYDEKGNTKIDFVGYFENINSDFKTVCQALHLDTNELPHRNKSSETKENITFKRFLYITYRNPLHLFNIGGDNIRSRNYKDYYTPSLIDKVSELYQKDIVTFKYDFENTMINN
ncbi:MAG: sulfotransferase family 2 domain-containing protein [Psychroserpens sp.]|nr:sulfotransferase family 2 domain-containing protein [Psychroserpens sp.]